MVNNCVVQGCVVGTAKQNVTLREFPKASWQDTSSALNISTGPLALRTFRPPGQYGPVHCIFHWPCRTTELNVGPVD